jgi:hypothetical protein
MLIQTFQTSLACRNNHRRNGVVEIITAEMVSARENSSQQNSPKKYLLRFFFGIIGFKTFAKYLILPEILSVINSRESGFSRILKSEGAIGCQRH